MIKPKDSTNQKLILNYGILGATSLSIRRRMQDYRFSTQYFVGDGIDVGCGQDSLALYKEFFPFINYLYSYDKSDGDAQLLDNVDDNSFDFLYSSHCLEHLDNPVAALQNWIRIVKPSGYLTIVVPDEDLYEQGSWPSIFNEDHKHTFTILKNKSWSKTSINVIDLLQLFINIINPISISLLDSGYRHKLHGKNFDQTQTPITECGIEIILKKC